MSTQEKLGYKLENSVSGETVRKWHTQVNPRRCASVTSPCHVRKKLRGFCLYKDLSPFLPQDICFGLRRFSNHGLHYRLFRYSAYRIVVIVLYISCNQSFCYYTRYVIFNSSFSIHYSHSHTHTHTISNIIQRYFCYVQFYLHIIWISMVHFWRLLNRNK